MAKRPQVPRAGRLLSKAQVILSAMILLLVIALGSTIILAYININSAGAFQAGYVLTDLANVQHEIVRLHVETNRLLRDRSKNVEPITLRRQMLDKHIQIARIESSNHQQVIAVLDSIDNLLRQYDYEIRYLSNNPTEAQYRSSAHQFDSILELLEKQIQRLYGTEELRFYRNIGDALRQQRLAQSLTLGIGGLLLIFGLMLALSVGRSVTGEFQRAYELLKAEVKERRRAEEELRQQNAYLAALHETSLALMNRLDLSELLQAIVLRAAQLLGTRHGFIYLLHPAQNTMEQRVGIGLYSRFIGTQARPGQGLAGQVWATGQPQLVNDYRAWPHRDLKPMLTLDTITAAIGVPLNSGSQVVGVLGLAHAGETDRHFTSADIVLLEGFAQLVSIALDNARLFSEAEERAVQINTLYQADTELYRHLELSSVLTALVDIAVDALKAHKSAFLLWDESCSRLVLGAARGYQPGTLAHLQFEKGQGLIGTVLQTLQPVVVQDTTSDRRVDWHITYPERIRSFMHVPVLVNDRVFGVFTVAYTEPRAFDDEDRRLILALAQRAAMAISNARLYQQAQQAATLEERQRLARELHDAVTQTLFSASIIADVLPQLWQQSPDEATRRATELRELTRGALAEMRTLLLELRPAALTESGLMELLHQLGEAARGRSRLPVSVSAEEPEDLPAEVKVVLYRIAQEALNNIIKHANATQVEIVLRQTRGTTCLCIRDNGGGFNPADLAPRSMGLRIMRERAESIGASLEIQSRANEGTSITVVWPPIYRPCNFPSSSA